ncbi:UvrD-helicase domain-containing protein [Roseovarius rhodophyticola]|uniref:UvrD-helicase domain-containing protein n=1 Tax=Roseovarius rhodophyticola TaxID=3080827 RepID=A0ABZ2TJL2_9RHOB
MDVYSDKLSELALTCEQQSDGRVIRRLESQFNALYIDEVQDLAGYDLELLELFLASKLKVTMVGDHRQATLATNQSPKHKKYRYAGIISLFEEWEKRIVYLWTSWILLTAAGKKSVIFLTSASLKVQKQHQ